LQEAIDPSNKLSDESNNCSQVKKWNMYFLYYFILNNTSESIKPESKS